MLSSKNSMYDELPKDLKNQNQNPNLPENLFLNSCWNDDWYSANQCFGTCWMLESSEYQAIYLDAWI